MSQRAAPTLWERTRWPRIAFVAGLVIGVLFGWFAHGVVSLVIRLFFVLIFLIPLAVALWFWFRIRRGDSDRDRGARTVYLDWDTGGRRSVAGAERAPTSGASRDEIEVIDIPEPRRARRSE